MTEKPIKVQQLTLLRERNIISQTEVVFMSGDLYVAEDVVTKTRRILQGCEGLLKEGKRILKG